jgi:hypothetical protein
MPQEYYTTSGIQLQAGGVQTVAQDTMVNLADTWSSLIPVDTLADKKGWAAQPYDFPNSYINLGSIPVRVQDPMSTYAMDQNNRFVQRYVAK